MNWRVPGSHRATNPDFFRGFRSTGRPAAFRRSKPALIRWERRADSCCAIQPANAAGRALLPLPYERSSFREIDRLVGDRVDARVHPHLVGAAALADATLRPSLSSAPPHGQIVLMDRVMDNDPLANPVRCLQDPELLG
jgi:hypothetical protein